MTRGLFPLAALGLLFAGCANTRAIETDSDDSEPITSHTWVLTSFSDGSPAPGEDEGPITLDLDANGASGIAACNRYFATVARSGNEIAFSQIGSTKMACREPLMRNEQRYLSALGSVTSWSRENGHLILSDSEGRELLTFVDAASTAYAKPLTGTVTYLPRIALPPNAVVTVKLLDASRADAPAETIAETSSQTGGNQVPIPFELYFYRPHIDPSHRYVVRAEIHDENGQLLWTTDTAYPVLTTGAPSDNVAITVVQVNEPAPPVGSNPSVLTGQTWRLSHLATAEGGRFSFGDPSTYTLRFGADGRYSGQADCNRIGGFYTSVSDGTLRLGQGISTLAACAPPSEGARYAQALGRAVSFTVTDGSLQVGLSGGGALVFSEAGGPSEMGYDIRPDSLRIDDEAMRFHVAIGYPLLSGAPNRTNASIRDSLRAFGDAFRPTEAPEASDNPRWSTTTVEGGYETAMARPDLFSALVGVYAYSGGAHGITVFRPINLNPQTGRWIEFGDVLRDTPALRQILADAVTDAAVQRQTENLDMTRDEALLSVSEFTRGGMHFDYTPLFTLTEDAMVIHISPYEVGPYALGTFAVPVPWDTVRAHVQEDSPVRRK